MSFVGLKTESRVAQGVCDISQECCRAGSQLGSKKLCGSQTKMAFNSKNPNLPKRTAPTFPQGNVSSPPQSCAGQEGRAALPLHMPLAFLTLFSLRPYLPSAQPLQISTDGYPDIQLPLESRQPFLGECSVRS